MRAFLIALLIYPFAEIFSLLTLADAIGGMWTFIWLLTSFFLGVFMMRNGKLASLLTVGSAMRQGQISLLGLLWPLRVMLAGLLFAIPGLISDIFAILLMMPWKGPVLADIAPSHNNATPGNTASGDIIEGEYQRVDKTVDPNSRLH